MDHACRISLAPMEGITGYVFRNAYASVFGGLDTYYTPFLSPGMGRGISKRERKEILPENNEGIHLVPQILTNRSDVFLHTAEMMKEFGYEEVNLNLGCPSGTVTAKGKGSGFLRYPGELRRFLDGIFSVSDRQISVKTRIGVSSEEEFEELLSIFNLFPIKELIIHPRLLTDGFEGTIHRKIFLSAVKNSRNPVAYNGDIRTIEDYRNLRESSPGTGHILIGRGILADPCLPGKIFSLEKGEDRESGENRESRENRECRENHESRENRESGEDRNEQVKDFLKCLRQGYERDMPEENNVLCRLKEVWGFLILKYPGHEKEYKIIKKTRSITEYETAAAIILRRET